MDTFGDWLGRELEQSSDFARERDRLRDEATRKRRATKPLSEFGSVEEMRAELQRAREAPRPERDFAWRSRSHMQGGGRGHTWVEEPCEPLAHVDRYSRRLQTRAYHFTGASANANPLLAYISGATSAVPIPGAVASLPAPTGHAASSIAAGFNGDVRWATATSRQAFNRYVAGIDPSEPTFYYFKRLHGSGPKPG